MRFLLGLSRRIDAADAMLGRALGWLILVAVVVSSVNAVVRYAFNASSNAWLETQWYLFGAVFLLGAGYTLLQNEHIKIDIVNARLPKRARDWIELIGHLFFLAPFCLVLIYGGTSFFWQSFVSKEYSSSAGGLILWPAKLLVPLGFAILLVQAMSEIIKRIAIMRGAIEEPHAQGGGHGIIE